MLRWFVFWVSVLLKPILNIARKKSITMLTICIILIVLLALDLLFTLALR